jgi:hypothetical protein
VFIQTDQKGPDARRAKIDERKTYVEVRCSESGETCMMDVGPHGECSGTMVETKAIVHWRHLDERHNVHTAGI